MAVHNQGILGGFSGKIGTVVGSSWRDKDIMKARPRYKRNRTKTELQEEQQARFKMAVEMTSKLESLIKTSFGKSGKRTATTDAYKIILDEGITGVYPTLTIDYSKLPIARGKLLSAWNGLATSPLAGKVQFTWSDNSNMNGSSPNDNSIMVVYCEELDALMYSVTGAIRSAGLAELDTPLFSGKQVHTWLSFIDANKVHTADSLYTGLVTVL